MKLRGIEFGSVWCSSGSLGFFGDGYWYHRLLKPFGLDFHGTTFVSKTTTLFPRKGNMALQEDGVTPKDLLPSCIKIRPWKGAVLNSVGLSGPGFFDLLDSGRWQKRTRPFLISFMSVASTPAERLMELRGFVSFFQPRLRGFQAPFGLEMNFSCPNVGLHSKEMASEAMDALETTASLGVPLVPNFGPDVSPETIWEVMNHPACDAVSIANTLKWGALPNKVDWEAIWGSSESPLADLGGGGMSGNPIFPVVHGLVNDIGQKFLPKPLVVGGGVMSSKAAEMLIRSGASAVKLGTVSMLRPWRVRGIIQKVRSMTP